MKLDSNGNFLRKVKKNKLHNLKTLIRKEKKITLHLPAKKKSAIEFQTLAYFHSKSKKKNKKFKSL